MCTCGSVWVWCVHMLLKNPKLRSLPTFSSLCRTEMDASKQKRSQERKPLAVMADLEQMSVSEMAAWYQTGQKDWIVTLRWNKKDDDDEVLQTAYHLAVSANQNITINIQCKQQTAAAKSSSSQATEEQWSKKGRLIEHKTVKISNAALSLSMSESSCNQTRQIFVWMIPTGRSVQRSSRQSDHTETSRPS